MPGFHPQRFWLIGLGCNLGSRSAESSQVIPMDSQGWELLPSQNASCWYEGLRLILFFFFGCTTRLAGSQFPHQGLNPGPGSESSESQPPGHQGTPRVTFILTSASKYRFLASHLCDNSHHLLFLEMRHYSKSLPTAIYKPEKEVKGCSGFYRSFSLQHNWGMKH